MTGIELIPAQGQDAVNISVELPVGTRLEVTKDIMLQLEEAVKQELDGLYENLIVRAGGRTFFGLGAVRTNTGRLTVTLPPAGVRKITSREVQNKLRPYFNNYPSAVFSFSQGGGGGGPGFNTSPIDIVIKALDLNKLATTGNQILDLVKTQAPEVTEPKLNLQQGLAQLDVVVRRDRLSDLGLNALAVGQEVRASIDGVNASRYRVEGREKDIVVILDERDRQLTRDLSRIFLMSPTGQRVSLSNIADTVVTSGPVDILRENQSRTLHLTGGLAPGARLDTTVEKLRNLIRENIPADETIVIDFSGDFENFIRYGVQLLLVLLVAVILVYGVMAAQFESFLDPFIIMFTIVLSFSGVFLIHFLTQTPISLFTAVGTIMLVGIVVNNGIVLVDYTNLLRKRGIPLLEAVVQAGRSRLRPVLMTSLTTILGLLPLAFVKTEGTDLVSPIGKTILGGLTTSTFLTLLVVPLVYFLFNRLSAKIRQKKVKPVVVVEEEVEHASS
jgi:HAE1 family hydrophobic/amphiphilic exporter-1